MTVIETQLLTELVLCKHQCLVELQELGRRQFALVDAGEVSELLQLLASKQLVLDRLRSIEGELDPFRSQRPEERSWATPEARAHCAALLERCETVFQQVLEDERRSEQRLIQRRDEAAARLEFAHASGQTPGAYSAEARDHHGQLDLWSES